MNEKLVKLEALLAGFRWLDFLGADMMPLWAEYSEIQKLVRECGEEGTKLYNKYCPMGA